MKVACGYESFFFFFFFYYSIYFLFGIWLKWDGWAVDLEAGG